MLASPRCPGPLHLALLLAVGLPATLAAEPIHVSGRVLLPAEPPQGLGGARVELLPQMGESPVATAKSEAGGFFELTAPESGCFRVRMRAEGYLSVEAPFLALVQDVTLTPTPALASSYAQQAAPGSPITGEWYFGAPAAAQPSPAATPRLAQGKVSDLKGAPVPGALVWSDGAPAVPCVKAGADGSFQIRLTAGGEAKLRAAGPGYLPSQAKPAPPPGAQGPPLVLKLAPARAIAGRVVDAAGQPLARVQITSLPLQGENDGSPAVRVVWSRADGRFRLPLLSPGKLYEVTATQEGFAPAAVKADALASPKPVRIVLERGATVAGKLQDPEGQPVQGAELTLTLSQEARFSQGLSWNDSPLGKAASDAAGSFAIPHLTPGRFELGVKRAGFAPLSLHEVEVPAGTARIDLGTLTLERAAAVEGRVTDSHGAPLPDSEVEVNPARDQLSAGAFDATSFAAAQTDSEGRFRFESLRRGVRLDLRVEHPGYVPVVIRTLEAPTQEPLRIELKTGRSLAGRVKSPEGKPVAGAEILLQTDTNGNQRSLGTTGEDGSFRLTGAQPGVVELLVRAQGYRLFHLRDLAVPEESDVEGLEITLQKGSALEVQVLDGRRQPVAGATVSAHVDSPATFGPWNRCQTDGAGRCRLEELDLGPYEVYAVAEKHGQVEAKVEIAPGINQRELVFPAGAQVAGQVSDETGAPVAGASLSLNPMGPGRAFDTASLADGSFQFPEVQDGTYRLSGTAPGFAGAVAPGEVQVAGQEVRGLALRLSRGATLTGRVLGLEPEELAGVMINALQVSEDASFAHHPFLSRTDREGRYKITDLAPGEWSVNAQVRGRSVQETLQIAPGAPEAVLDLRFPAGFTITGRVMADHAPLVGADVGASSSAGSFHGLAGPDGGFQIPNVPPGRYTLIAIDPEGLGTSANVEVTGDQEIDLDFSTGGLRVTALAAGAPVANAFVHLSGAIPFSGRGGWVTDAAGGFEAPRIAAGAYTVYVQREGFEPASASVEIRPGAVAEVRVELKPSQ